MNPVGGLRNRLLWTVADRGLRRQIARVEAYLKTVQPAGGPPVLFFNASTRIHRLSLNGGFSLLASWALRARGTPVRHAVCQRGMDLCILGTPRDLPQAAPPCRRCLRLSRWLFPPDLVQGLRYDAAEASAADAELARLDLDRLVHWTWKGMPLGELCLPGLRWALRRHHLADDEATRLLYRRYLRSAASLAAQFQLMLERIRPQALVAFNGITYPEAVARHVARGKGIPVITHEVGLRPFSAFFSHKEATFRDVDMPDGFELGPQESARLDSYLKDRWRGRFTMAGIRFWPEMQPLPSWLEQRIGAHQQMVPIFTNVIFDTSQVHANTLFEDMFAWLDDLREVIERHPETLFVIRAHPDEARPGKESQESVAEWVRSAGIAQRRNVAFFAPSDYVSSYELIRQAKVVLVYNSSVGLEASILGKPVLCAGRARYTQVPTVFYPPNRDMYRSQLEAMLTADEIEIPASFVANARRFLYSELFHASLDFSSFLQPYPEAPGMVRFRDFDPPELMVSGELRAVCSGIGRAGSFNLPASREDAG